MFRINLMVTVVLALVQTTHSMDTVVLAAEAGAEATRPSGKRLQISGEGYINDEHGFGVVVPDRWTTQEGSGLILAFFFSPSDGLFDDFAENVNILAGPTSSSTIFDVRRDLENGATVIDPNATILESDIVELPSGRQAARVSYSGVSVLGDQLIWMQLATVRDGTQYLLTYTGSPTGFFTHFDEGFQILHTFTFLDELSDEVALNTEESSNPEGCWAEGAGADICSSESWRFSSWESSRSGVQVAGSADISWSNISVTSTIRVEYELRFFDGDDAEVGRTPQRVIELEPGESLLTRPSFSLAFESVADANEVESMAIFATFVVTATTQRTVVVRLQIGSRRFSGPEIDVSVDRRVRIVVLEFTQPDMSDTVEVDGYTMTIDSRLGERLSDTQFRTTTQAGVTGTVRVRSGSESSQVDITTTPGSVAGLLIEPSEVTLRPGESVDFNAVGVDEFGNQFTLRGVNLGWTVVPESAGEIDSRTGVFTAGSGRSEGYVVAVVDRALRFGTSDVRSGTRKFAVLTDSLALLPVSPNPFNSSTTIRYSIDQATHVRLDVVNALGQVVDTIIDKEHGPGVHEHLWPADGLPSGTYYLRLTTRDGMAVRKSALVR